MGERRFTEAELAGEVWAPIPDTLGTYAASTLGRVKNRKPPLYGRPLGEGNVLAEWPDDRGYHHVSLRIGTEQVSATIGALMLMAFVGPRPTDDHVACFRDGDPGNLAVDNLAWLTPLERARGARTRGTSHARPFRLDDGHVAYRCGRCQEWKPADDFPRLKQTYSPHGNPMSRCGRGSECRACDNQRRTERRRVARRNGGSVPPLAEQILPLLFELDKLDVSAGDTIAPTPAERIRAARETAGVSRHEVSRRAGVHPQTMDAIERGENTPRPQTLRKIIDALRGQRAPAARATPASS